MIPITAAQVRAAAKARVNESNLNSVMVALQPQTSATREPLSAASPRTR